MRGIGERVRAALWAILAIAALAILGLIALLLVHAARANALIVQSFQVPPALATQGLSGQVVATEVLDKLAEMQAQSESMRAASSYDNNWGDDLKIDIPNTGATADQIWKLLRGWLGKETRISGEVIQTPEGLALTARAGAKPGERFVSKNGDLDALVTKAAELIYRETQPYRYSVYLAQFPDRGAEQRALLVGLTRDPSDARAQVGIQWPRRRCTRQAGNFRGALGFARRALAIDPRMQPAFGNSRLARSACSAMTRRRSIRSQGSMLFRSAANMTRTSLTGNLCNEDAMAAFAQRDPVAGGEGGGLPGNRLANSFGAIAGRSPRLCRAPAP